MIKNNKNEKADRPDGQVKVPAFIKYGLLAVAVVAVVVIGIVLYMNIAGGYVATVDGQKIRTGEYKYYLEVQKQSMFLEAYYSDNTITEETFWDTPINGYNPLELARNIALSNLKSIKVQYLKAKEAKIALTADELSGIDNYIQESIIDSMGAGNKIKANKAVKKEYGFTLDDLRAVLIESNTAQKYIYQEINNIPDEDANVETWYAQKPEWYKEDISSRNDAEEAVWARHILVKFADEATQADKDAAKKKAEDLIAQLKNGADFATLVKENSEDDGSKENGGEYIFGKGDMVTPFEEASFALKPGEITNEPVLTDYGYHIIKLEEKIAKDEPVSLRCAQEFNEYGTYFVKYKIVQDKVEQWVKDVQYKENTTVLNSIS